MPAENSFWKAMVCSLNECCCGITAKFHEKKFNFHNEREAVKAAYDNRGLESDLGVNIKDMNMTSKYDNRVYENGNEGHEYGSIDDINDANNHLQKQSIPKSQSEIFDDGKHLEEKSADAESGYGRSLGESLDSVENGEYFQVVVAESGTKATFKLIVESKLKCWIVYRRQLEFIYIQEYLKNQTGKSIMELSVDKKANIAELQSLVIQIASDPTLMKIDKVREFFHLNHHDTGSHTSLSLDIQDSPPSSRLEKESLPGAKISQRKQGVRNEWRNDDKSTLNNGIFLGCNERRMRPSDFKFYDVIGKGTFGKVMLAKLKENNQFYAVKILCKKFIAHRNETAHVLSERYALTKVLDHPFIVRLHFAFTTSSRIFFVLDYINGGELFYHLQRERKFSEEKTKFYAAEICSALSYLHQNGIVYRDLKPENILLDAEGHVVLTDFGLCKEGLESADSRTHTFCGTPEYLAPEIILKLSYTRSVDWWTLGAVLYEMLYGLPPFYNKNVSFMYDAIVNRPLHLNTSISNHARNFLYQLLHKSPVSRLGSGPRDAEEVMEHKFFEDIDWDMVESRQLRPPFIPEIKNDLESLKFQSKLRTTNESFLSSAPNVVDHQHPSPEDAPFKDFHYISPEFREQLRR